MASDGAASHRAADERLSALSNDRPDPNVCEAIRGKPSVDWLKPFMTERHFSKGDVLFAKGEPADEMFCAVTGRYVLTEFGIEPGQVVGELAMLAPDNRHTAMLECVEDGKVLSITYEHVEQLYYQNPTFGFYFLRLATARLFNDIGRLESELTRQRAAPALDYQATEIIACFNGLCWTIARGFSNFESAGLGCR
jgi:hypothetical protein